VRHLLFIAHRIPFPPDKGDKIRSHHILRHLAEHFTVHLGCFYDNPADKQHINALRDLCEEVFCLPLGRTQRTLGGLRALAVGRSLSEGSFANPRMKKWIRDVLHRCDIEAAFAYCSAMTPYLLGDPFKGRKIVDMVDVDSEKWGAYAQAAHEPLATLFRVEQRRVRELEKKAATCFDNVLFVSREEANIFLEFAPEARAKVSYVENGVDLRRFDPAQLNPNPFIEGVDPIVFTGAMDYRPNIDAVVWFSREAFPAIRAKHPRAEFWIVGGNPTKCVRNLVRDSSITVTGTVPDVRPYLAHSRCAVAPMRVARGIQNKVLEAMAMAKPVVLSPAALEGLRAEPGRDLLLARDAQEFTALVSQILSGRWHSLGGSARKYVEVEHRWTENLKVLDEFFNAPRIPAQLRALQ
jgi:sugar transferase (PEP-CTERM/EpsH1 system associated)